MPRRAHLTALGFAAEDGRKGGRGAAAAGPWDPYWGASVCSRAMPRQGAQGPIFFPHNPTGPESGLAAFWCGSVALAAALKLHAQIQAHAVHAPPAGFFSHLLWTLRTLCWPAGVGKGGQGSSGLSPNCKSMLLTLCMLCTLCLQVSAKEAKKLLDRERKLLEKAAAIKARSLFLLD